MIKVKYKKILKLAAEISGKEMDNELEVARKCRMLNQLRINAGINDNIFDFFLGIDSIIDDHGIPLDEEVRKRWNQESLRALDNELKNIIKFYKKDILMICRDILNRYK